MRILAAWCLLATLLLSNTSADAQFITSLSRYHKNDTKANKTKLALHKRIYLGYGQQWMNNPYTFRYRDTMYTSEQNFIDRIGGQEIDTTIQTSARLTKALNGYLGVSVPISMVSAKSMVCLDIEANVLMGELTYDTVTVPLGYKLMPIAEPMPFMMVSGPISVNFKYGGDATLSKDNRTMLSAGAGIAASYITVDDGLGAEAVIAGVPFVKAEIGFFAGLAFKLRGTAYMGRFEMLNSEAEQVSRATGIISGKYEGNFGYNLSLIVMPLSFTWDDRLIR